MRRLYTTFLSQCTPKTTDGECLVLMKQNIIILNGILTALLSFVYALTLTVVLFTLLRFYCSNIRMWFGWSDAGNEAGNDGWSPSDCIFVGTIAGELENHARAIGSWRCSEALSVEGKHLQVSLLSQAKSIHITWESQVNHHLFLHLFVLIGLRSYVVGVLNIAS